MPATRNICCTAIRTSRHSTLSSLKNASHTCIPSNFFPKSRPFHSPITHLSHRLFSSTVPAAKDTDAPSDDSDDDLDDFLEDEDEFEENVGMDIDTAGTDWGESALQAVQRLIAADDTLALYSFRAIARSKRIDIRIDKLTNQFGSPSLDEVGEFSYKLNAELEATLGEEAAGEIEIEVSSPGAERLVKVPDELSRFAELPMMVQYENAEADQSKGAQVLQYEGLNEDESVTLWKLADVRANRSGKGRGLNKKQRETIIEIPVGAIHQVNLHVDI